MDELERKKKEREEAEDIDDFTTLLSPIEEISRLSEPYEFSGWECELFGTGRNGLTLRPDINHVPNFFWRWMQYLIFGNKWRQDG